MVLNKKEQNMFNRATTLSIKGIIQTYKYELMIMFIAFVIVSILGSFLLNFKSIFSSYKNIKQGFVPEIIYHSSSNNDKLFQLLNNNSNRLLKESTFGELTIFNTPIDLNGNNILHNEKRYIYNIFLKKHNNIMVNSTKETIHITRIRKGFNNTWKLYTKPLSVDEGSILIEFNNHKLQVEHKKSRRSSYLTIKIKKDNYEKFYSLFKSFINQFIDIDSIGIEKEFEKNNNEKFHYLSNKYDTKIETLIKMYIKNSYILASKDIYNEISNYRMELVRAEFLKKRHYVKDFVNFPIETNKEQNLHKFFLVFDKKLNKSEYYFIFYYGKDIKGFKELIASIDQKGSIYTKNELLPSLHDEEIIVSSIYYIIGITLIILVSLMLISIINLFYKSYGAEIYFLKTYGFRLKVFSISMFLIASLAIVISIPILDIIYSHINTLINSYFFPSIEFYLQLDAIFYIYMILIALLYIYEIRLFSKLNYGTKDEL